MELHYLVYISYSSPTLEEASLVDLLHRARSKNRVNNITGVLLMYNRRFIQVLEGPKENVLSTFESINKDSRHHGAIVVSQGGLEERNFKKWAMAYEKVASDEIDTPSEADDSGKQVLNELLKEETNPYHPSMTLLKMFQKRNMDEVLELVDSST